MAFVQTRNIQSGEVEVKRFVDLATQGGYGIIELVWSMFRKSNAKVTGFEIPVDSRVKEMGFVSGPIEVDLNIDVQKVVGQTRFYLDASGRCWGYILDTPYNRNKLAQQLKVGWYKIVDPNIRKEIVKLAEENEWPTQPVPKPKGAIKTSKRERELGDQLEIKRKEVEALITQLEKSKKNFAVAKGDVKPLAGVRLKKD
jgi:hypothetical protein